MTKEIERNTIVFTPTEMIIIEDMHRLNVLREFAEHSNEPEVMSYFYRSKSILLEKALETIKTDGLIEPEEEVSVESCLSYSK